MEEGSEPEPTAPPPLLIGLSPALFPDLRKDEKSARMDVGLGFGLCRSSTLLLSNRPDKWTLAR
jgi:hypothetical protein